MLLYFIVKVVVSVSVVSGITMSVGGSVVAAGSAFMKRYLYQRTTNFAGFLGSIAEFFRFGFWQCLFCLLIGEVCCHGGDVIANGV